MTLAIENFFSGTVNFATFNGSGSISSAHSSALNSSGANRLMVLVFGTGRSQTSGTFTSSPVNTVTAAGLTWTRRFTTSYNYNPVTIAGSGNGSFPNACMAFDVWTAPAASAVSSLAWSSTTQDGFVNNQIVWGFAVSGLADINDPGFITAVIAQNLTASNTHPEIPGVSTNASAVVLAMFSARNSGFTYTAESGYTLNQNSAGGDSTSNVKFGLNYFVEPSPIASKTIGDATGSIDCWYGVAFAIGATDSANGSASGATTTVTSSLIAGSASGGANGSASGSTITATLSVNSGTAAQVVDANASGVTLIATASLTSGVASEAQEIDGTEIFEITFNTVPSGQYQEADYYSIYSIGSRYQNGLITLTEIGITYGAGATPAGAFDNSYGQAAGSGWNPSGSGALGMAFQTGTMLAGLRFIGAGQYTERTTTWQLVAGMGPSSVFLESYATEFDYFVTSQNQAQTNFLYYSEFLMTPRIPIEWPYYQFRTFPSSVSANSERFAEEIEFKVFHSILDGGDRRSSNGRPSKQVTITLSPDWGMIISSGIVHPNDAWLDGSIARSNAPGVTYNHSSIGANGGGGSLSGPQNTVGAYIEFEFPRPVIHQHIVLQVQLPEVYSSGNPTRYGKWHWEYSKNGGATWTPIGIQWWFFQADGAFMLAPHTGETFGLAGDATLGEGATRWRMVLDAGPAFGGTYTASEILFNVIDSEELVAQLTVAFSDDVDGDPVFPTLGAPGTPYIVAFSDGSSDVLSLTLENTPNPVLTIAFTDEGTFETWSDLYPSVTVQTIVVATGMA